MASKYLIKFCFFDLKNAVTRGQIKELSSTVTFLAGGGAAPSALPAFAVYCFTRRTEAEHTHVVTINR